MFRHQFEVKSNTQIKASERKTIKEKFASIFPLSQEDLSELFSKKSAIHNVKIVTPDGKAVLLYVVNKIPMAFIYNENLFPTVFLLWKYPTIFPSFATHENVLKYVRSGADLMLPGVIIPDQPNFFNSKYGNLLKGDIVYVNLNTNGAAVAIGIAAQSSLELLNSGGKGKCVSILHFYGDKLSKFDGLNMAYPQMDPPFTEVGEVYTDIDATALSSNDMGQQVSSNSLLESEEAEEPPEMSIDEMDELLKFCFYSAVKYSKTLKLPILTSTFYKVEMLPQCPPEKKLDIKKTSFKKFKSFVDHMQSLGVITVREVSKGVEHIVSVNKDHDLLKQFYVDPENRRIVVTETEGGSNLAVVEKYMVTPGVSEIFLELGYKKGDALLPSEIRKFVTTYAKNKRLQNPEKPGLIKPNALISKICRTEEEISWEKLMDDVINRMKKCLEVKSGQEEIFTKGDAPKIYINVANRSGNKKVTLVDNLEPYGINLAEFSKECMHGVAASTSISRPPGKKYDQLMVQGNQVIFIQNLLTDKYKIPKRFIVGVANAPKKKKK